MVGKNSYTKVLADSNFHNPETVWENAASPVDTTGFTPCGNSIFA
jgi:hypothetical protein